MNSTDCQKNTQLAPTIVGDKDKQEIKALNQSLYFAQGFAGVLPDDIFCGFMVKQDRDKLTKELKFNKDGTPRLRKLPISITSKVGIQISQENASEHLGTIDKLGLLHEVEYIGLPFYAGMSQTANGYHLLCLDVDLKRATEPSKQAQALEVWAKASGHYFERSHSRKGFHIFIAVKDTSNIPAKIPLDVAGAEIEVFSHDAIKCMMLTGLEVADDAVFNDVAIDLISEMASLGIDIKPAKHTAKSTQPSDNSYGLEVYLQTTKANLKDALAFLSPDDYSEWIANGMALKTLPNGEGRDIWDKWSARSSKYDFNEAQAKWDSFEPTSTGCEAIFAKARSAGYANSMAAEQLWGALNKISQQTAGVKKFPVKPIAQAVRELLPPVYVLQNLLQKNHLYTLTARNNAGKTTWIVTVTRSIALGEPLGTLQAIKGRVLILSGENSADTNLKFRYLAEVEKVNLDNIDVLEMAFELKNGGVERLMAELESEYALVIVDSLQAYFGGGDFNNNADQLAHLQACRKLTELRGNPAVIVLAHPTKSAEILEPYGGGALMNEIDGNLTLKLENGIAVLHHTKLRQSPFMPLDFQLNIVEIPDFEDNFGKQATTTLLTPLDSALASAIKSDNGKLSFQILDLLLRRNLSKAELAKTIFGDDDGKHTSKIYRLICDLQAKKFLTDRGDFELTAKGKSELTKLRKIYPAERDLGIQISKFGGLKNA